MPKSHVRRANVMLSDDDLSENLDQPPSVDTQQAEQKSENIETDVGEAFGGDQYPDRSGGSNDAAGLRNMLQRRKLQ